MLRSGLRSRSPRHAEELFDWTDRFIRAARLIETPEEKRLRHAACLMADIGWRAHPDYRGEQSLNIIANAAFVGVDHPGRTFIALAVFFRPVGLIDETSQAKKGIHTPGVQRQWCGSLGKIENCIVTVHLGIAWGRFTRWSSCGCSAGRRSWRSS